MAEILIILDFDKTIIDVDSDYWVVDELGVTDLFNQLLPTMPLNHVMTRMMDELHSQGKTIEQVVDVLKRIPIHPQIIHALKSAHASGCELRIISDANTFFIDTILEHVGLKDCFTEINTNPGFIDQEGRLKISPFNDRSCCSLCPSNMCKGRIIERIQTSNMSKKIIYVGDGAGDYCPSLKLTPADYVMPRKNFPVWDLICENFMIIKAGIHEWSDGVEFERVLLQIIMQYISSSDNFLSDDCKLLALPIMPLEALPRAPAVAQ